MKKQINHVQDFHIKFEVPYKHQPEMPSKERCALRYKLLKEELEEFKDACDKEDMVEASDALVDLAYILFGSVIEFGLQDKFEEMFEEVQRSNMSKLGEDGKPVKREDGKVMKGPHFFKPNLKAILES